MPVAHTTDWLLAQSGSSISGGGGDVVWDNPEKITDLDDAEYADCYLEPSERSNECRGLNFAPTFPVGATLTGVESRIRIGIYDDINTHVKDYMVKLVVDGAKVGNNLAKSAADEWDTYEMRTYGGINELFGLEETLTLAKLAEADFGIGISGENIDPAYTAHIRVFSIEMRFHYTLPGTDADIELPGIAMKAWSKKVG